MKKYSLLLIITFILMHFQIGKASFELQDRNGSANYSAFMISPNYFKKGSDCDRIEAAIREAVKSGINSIEIPGYDNVKDKTI